jgi:GAF domain-containing protein
VVGPFQGRPACVRIAVGRGVCGTAVKERRSIVVPDVDAFPGHIACDAASRAELVVPLFVGERVAGVLDLDSPRHGRFDDADRLGLEAAVRLFVAASDW